MKGRTGATHPNYGQKVEGSETPSQAIEVFDLKENTTTSYNFIREAAKFS
jgi:hypothetical protein